ncbi:acyl-CoA thioesterase [Aminobacter sp. LjRoot7]|uniref:acyl-CoA thioesterase n=1 Tax=Aminobacter sp. LjRoot7 TaxID=3342335 RepID=UPI003ECCD495
MIPNNASRTAIMPRVSETDGAGHINNVTSAIWFEAGRRDIFQAFTPDLSFDRWAVAVISMEIRYKRQIYLASEVSVLTWLRAIGRTSFHVNEVIMQDGSVCSAGRCSYVHMDYAINRPAAIPEDVRARLELVLADTPEFDKEFAR